MAHGLQHNPSSTTSSQETSVFGLDMADQQGAQEEEEREELPCLLAP